MNGASGRQTVRHGPPSLAEIRVLDLSWLAPGPYATMLLADLGADVVKIERPEDGDYLREMMPDAFYALNRNKRSVALNMKEPEGRAVFHDMVGRADVVVEGFRPGVMDRLGVGYDDLVRVNPALVYCSISGYGQTGPWRDVPGHDLAYLAMGGGLSIPGDLQYPAVRPSLPIADLSSAMFAALSIMAALFDARATGRGDKIDLSMTDAVTSWATARLGAVLQSGEDPIVLLSALNRTYEAADGRSIALAVVEDKMFVAFCRCLGLEDWLDDARFATMTSRVDHAEEMLPVIRGRIAERTRDEWIDVFHRAGISAAPVLGPNEVFESAHATARGLVQEVVDGEGTRQRHFRYPARFAHRDTTVRRSPPMLGQDTREVLEEYGIDVATIDRVCMPSSNASPGSYGKGSG